MRAAAAAAAAVIVVQAAAEVKHRASIGIQLRIQRAGDLSWMTAQTGNAQMGNAQKKGLLRGNVVAQTGNAQKKRLLKGECSESSSQDGDESELGEVAEVTGDLSEFAGMSAAQEVKEETIETQTEHIRKHGQNHQCPRCRSMRHREEIFKTCTYQCPSGSIGTWVEEVCRPGRPWGLGCKLCRWAGVNSIWSRGCVRSDRGTQLTSLMRHGNHRPEKTRKGKTNKICRVHEESQQKLLDSEKPSDERGGVSPADDLRSDVPTLA